MKITTNKTGDPEKPSSERRYKDEKEKKKQESMEGKDTPFQNALRDAESRNKKQFHYNDKTKKSSDEPFEGSRPIATKSSGAPERKPIETKPRVLPHADPKVKGNPHGSIEVKLKSHTITPKFDQKQKGKRSHGVVKNTLLRKIDKAINPGKYGAESNAGKNININRSSRYKSGKTKPSGYDINVGGDKTKKISVKKLKPKQIIKAAKEKGYIK